ncbi:hypothetical protein FLAT13_00439 [Flavobacterium salmonis]|uniref:Uncharacterized protein n=1 Tax=Flavobacterium salmonis TaxID=2654844 RepID=A0A6V6YNY4_9FLAO|nr:hypothetical protein FLAT13_00439 [Flavobacterium salmonis]
MKSQFTSLKENILNCILFASIGLAIGIITHFFIKLLSLLLLFIIGFLLLNYISSSQKKKAGK